MLATLISKLKFFESDNGYDKKMLPSDIDTNFKTISNKVDEKVGKDFIDDAGAVEANNKNEVNALLTTDDTQTEIQSIIIKPKGSALLKISGVAVQDDYATEWGFERTVLVVVDGGGSITIDADNNTDIVKDDTDWKFDVAGVNDATNPSISLKVTGKASVNIIWYSTVETQVCNWK